jgi:hypothetical protein
MSVRCLNIFHAGTDINCGVCNVANTCNLCNDGYLLFSDNSCNLCLAQGLYRYQDANLTPRCAACLLFFLPCCFFPPYFITLLPIGSTNCLSCQGDGAVSECSSCESNFFVDEMGGCSNCLFCAFRGDDNMNLFTLFRSR